MIARKSFLIVSTTFFSDFLAWIGIVILATILQSIGVPLEGIALILGVDRILDMCRTTINVTGDLTASLFMKRVLGIK